MDCKEFWRCNIFDYLVIVFFCHMHELTSLAYLEDFVLLDRFVLTMKHVGLFLFCLDRQNKPDVSHR